MKLRTKGRFRWFLFIDFSPAELAQESAGKHESHSAKTFKIDVALQYPWYYK